MRANAAAAAPAQMSLPRAYLELTKPRIIGLLLVTTYATMLVAGGEVPAWDLIFWTILGGALTSGSANAYNMVYDRDIDAVMKRTRWRPLPSGRIKPAGALVFATVLGVAGVAELAYFVNPLAAALALFGELFYVFVYTMSLKRNTVHNIVIGGAAGAVPPLVGWAAVTGTLDWAAVMLFLVIFLWTPPHSWALALYKNADYTAVDVPMLPVVRGRDATIQQILFYTVLLIASTVVFVFVHPLTFFYLATALVLGAGFAYFAIRLAQRGTDGAAKQLFAYSIVYLGLIFGAMVYDQLGFAAWLQPVRAPVGIEGFAVDVTRKLEVRFAGAADADLPLTVEPAKDKIKMHPNERIELSYRVTNTSDQPLTVTAEHEFQPPEAGGFYKKVECFCFTAQTLAPGESKDLPLVVSFVDALPLQIEGVSVTYRFKRADPHAGHAH